MFVVCVRLFCVCICLVCAFVCVSVSVSLSVCACVYVWVSTSERQFACPFVCGWVGIAWVVLMHAKFLLNRVCMCSVVCISTVCIRS